MSKVLGAIRAVWNGPFHVGKLQQPVKIGDVAAKVLETVWRAGVILSCVISIALLVSGVSHMIREAQREQMVRESRNYDAAVSYDRRLRISVTHPAAECPAGRPINVTVSNLSNDHISWYRYSFGARYEGRSTNLLLGEEGAYATSDYILSPRSSLSYCHAIPPALAGLMNGERVVFFPNGVSSNR